MALALATGAAIFAGGVYAATPGEVVNEDTANFLETRKKGILMSTNKAPRAMDGVAAFLPYAAPPQDVLTVTQAQEAYTKQMAQGSYDMAKFNLRNRDGGRVLLVNAGNSQQLIGLLGSGKLGDVKNSDMLYDNPLVARRNTIGMPSVRQGDGQYSGTSQADDSSKRFPDRINLAGPTFVDRINPYSRGGAFVNLNNQLNNAANGGTIPAKGFLVPSAINPNSRVVPIVSGI